MAKNKKKRNSRPQRSIATKRLYKFDSNRELTEGEKEMFGVAEEIAERVHYAGMAAAAAYFVKLDFDEIKQLCRPFDDEIRKDANDFFMKAFYEAYCNGFEEGSLLVDQQDNEETDKKITPTVCKR
jgi:hypothetical protein